MDLCQRHGGTTSTGIWTGIHITLKRMASSGMLHIVAFVGTDISEERSASIIRVTSRQAACVGC
jgi:hypothetical protein